MRFWLDKDDDNTNLIVVSDEAVYAEQLDGPSCQRRVAELNAGKSPATVFGADATHVVLRSVSRVQQSSDDEDIDFITRDGKDEKTKSITIRDPGLRAEIFTAIEKATQGRFARHEDQYSRPRAAFASALALTIVGFLTKISASAAAVIASTEDYEVEGRKQGLKRLIVWILDLLGPTGVWIVGGLICALAAWSLYTKIKSPPSITLLQAEPYKPQHAAVTTLKYLALAAIWFLFFPLLLR
jgi:hypothetical protein